MEDKIINLEKTIKKMDADIQELYEVFKMHIRSHIVESQPIELYEKFGVSNGISYTWGSYYRAPVTRKAEIYEQEPEI
jgi:hypothetical protein